MCMIELFVDLRLVVMMVFLMVVSLRCVDDILCSGELSVISSGILFGWMCGMFGWCFR